MKVLLVSNWFPPVRSGSSYYTSSLAQALAAKGHEIAVVTLDWGPEYAPPEGLQFPVYRLPVARLPKLPLFYNLKLMGLAFTPGNVRRLKELVLKFKPDVLHHVNHIFDTTFLSVNVSKWAGIPVVGSITTPIQHGDPVRQAVMTVFDRMTVGLFGVQKWDAVVSLDSTVHRYVGNLYGKKTQTRSFVVPFGVRMESSAQYESNAGEKAKCPQIIFVGHIHPFRNPVQLIRAMPLILKEVPDVRLILAGRVDLKEPVKIAHELKLNDENVQFLGETAHEEVVWLIKSSHVFASWVTGPYPSLGTAPMEAMLCGTPVINDIPEDLFGENKLKNAENIMLVNSRDPRSIADMIVRLLKDEKLRQKIGSGGRRFVMEHLSWAGIAGQMEALYAGVLKDREAKRKR